MKNTYKKIITLILLNLITLIGFSQYSNAFRFRINGNGYTDETVIRLVNGASLTFDGMYDAWKLFSPNPNVPSIYTQISVGQELSINSLPEFTEDKSITIYTNIPADGTYTLDFEEIYALSSNYKISLTAIASTTHFRLLGDTALSFTFNTQQNSPSFTFNISTPIVSSASDETCFSMNDGSLMVNNAGNTDWEIEIFDASSSLIMNSTSNLCINNFNNLMPGSYTAKVSSKGIIDEFNFTINSGINLIADFNLAKDTVYLSEGGLTTITNTSQNAQNYSWNFGDGGLSIDENPSYTYSNIGVYDVTLTALTTNCVSQNTKQLAVLLSPSVVSSVASITEEGLSLVHLGNGKFNLTSTDYVNKQIKVFDVKGSLIFDDVCFNKSYQFSLTNNSSGIYILNVVTEKGTIFQEKLFR